jgi:hypothetical protein
VSTKAGELQGELTSLMTLCELGDVQRLSASRKAVRIAGIDIGVHRSDRRAGARVGKLNAKAPRTCAGRSMKPHSPPVAPVVPRGQPTEGQVCERLKPPSDQFVDVADIPERKPTGNVPYTERDGYWLTPIEVPFYDALRETGAIFAVQPWVQGVSNRYRPDFIVFYDGGIVIVELDGHETHKSRDQRTYDARRQRWFEARGMRVLRWTGSEVTRNPQECVRELLEILRGNQARF